MAAIPLADFSFIYFDSGSPAVCRRCRDRLQVSGVPMQSNGCNCKTIALL